MKKSWHCVCYGASDIFVESLNITSAPLHKLHVSESYITQLQTRIWSI